MAVPTSMVTVPFVSTDPTNNIGGIYLDNGSITSNGSGTLTVSTVSATTYSPTILAGGVVSPTTSTGGTIQTSAARVIKATVAAGAQATNLTLATGISGQDLTIINENAVGGSTLVITGNVVVTSGTTTVTISGLAGAKFCYDSTQSAWVKL